MAAAFAFAGSVEFERSVGLEMERFFVVAREENELFIQTVGVCCVVEGEVGEEMRVDLRLVGACGLPVRCCQFCI